MLRTHPSGGPICRTVISRQRAPPAQLPAILSVALTCPAYTAGIRHEGTSAVRIDQLTPAPTAAPPLEIPPQLLDSVHRHQTHLSALIGSLRAAGLSEAMVDVSIRTLVDSYAEDLTIAIRAMMQEPRHG